MHYFTWKLELVSDILWMIVGSVSIELKYLVVVTPSQQRHVNNTRHFKVSFVQNKFIIIATETKVYHFGYSQGVMRWTFAFGLTVILLDFLKI